MTQDFLLDQERNLKSWGTEPGLKNFLIQTLHKKEDTYKGTEGNTKWINQAIKEQNDIGRDMLWKGFSSQTWGDIQESYYRRNKSKGHQTGATWAKKLVRELWKFFLEIWKLCNATLHRKTEHTQVEKQILQACIEELYTKHKGNQGKYKFLFKSSIWEIKAFRVNKLK